MKRAIFLALLLCVAARADTNAQYTIKQPLNMNGYQINNLENPSVGTDAATKEYVDGSIVVPRGALTTTTTGVSIGNGSTAVIGSGTTVNIQTANGSQPGLLDAADWTTFNSKQDPISANSCSGSQVANGISSAGVLSCVSGGVALTFADSLVDSSGTVTLVGDSDSPGDSQYYGTNSGGTLGYYSLPSGASPGGSSSDVQYNSSSSFAGSSSFTFNSSTGAVTATLIDAGSAGSTSSPAISIDGNGGIYSPSSNQVGVVAGTTDVMNMSSTSISPQEQIDSQWSSSASSPSFVMSNDYSSGIYRPGTNEVGISISSSNVATFSSTGLSVTGTISGTLSGNASSATEVATTAETSSSSLYYPLFVASSSNGNQASALSADLQFQPSTNSLKAPAVTGSSTGIGLSVVAGASANGSAGSFEGKGGASSGSGLGGAAALIGGNSSTSTGGGAGVTAGQSTTTESGGGSISADGGNADGSGGLTTMYGGQAGTSGVNAVGGAAVVNGGQDSSGDANSGAQVSVGGEQASGQGGELDMYAGGASAASFANGASISLYGATSDGSGSEGVYLGGTGTGAAGGSLFYEAGAGDSGFAGGNVTIQSGAGDGVSNTNYANIVLSGADGTGNNASITLTPGPSGSINLSGATSASSIVASSVSMNGQMSAGSVANSAQQTTLTGSAGTAVCSEPEQGSSYVKALCHLSGYTDTGTQTFTFPTSFQNAPYVYGASAIVSGATVTTSSVTFNVTTQTGFVFIEGY